MRLVDSLYTKVILSIIAGCLVVISFEQAHWSKLEPVQAQQPVVCTISGYNFGGKQIPLGNGAGEGPGIPVVQVNATKVK
jgi:hypothetical protein